MKFCLYSTKQTQAVHMATKYGDFVKWQEATIKV